jgi:hypothetical protein
MTDKQTPPDWVLIEAAKRSGWQVLDGDLCVPRYWLNNNGAFRALCDMIERYEQPPVDRKLLCAEQAMYELQTRAAHRIDGSPVTTAKDVAVRAIELWEEGFGK